MANGDHNMYVLNNGSTKMISESENASKVATLKGFRIGKRHQSSAGTSGTGTTTSKTQKQIRISTSQKVIGSNFHNN
jgi:Sec7-like guanine-nucleotide exchange factor